MSKNNLAEHISWLLSSAPFVPPLLQRPAIASAADDSALEDLGILQSQHGRHTTCTYRPRETSHMFIGSSAILTRKLTPLTGELADQSSDRFSSTVDRTDPMARLQIAPKPAKKLNFTQLTPSSSTKPSSVSSTVQDQQRGSLPRDPIRMQLVHQLTAKDDLSTNLYGRKPFEEASVRRESNYYLELSPSTVENCPKTTHARVKSAMLGCSRLHRSDRGGSPSYVIFSHYRGRR